MILAFAVASIIVTYRAVIELTRTKQSLSQPNKKLIFLNSILADIYEAESNIRTYTLTHDDEYINYYFSFLISIDSKVDSLLIYTKDNPGQRKKIRFIKTLLDRKGKVLEELISLKQQDKSSFFYDKALQEIAHAQTLPEYKSPIIAKTTTTTISKKDTLFGNTVGGNDGFFGKVKSWFSGSKKKDTTITQTNIETRIDTLFPPGIASDSLIGNVVKILNQIKREQEEVKSQVGLKELELLNSDKDLMDEIRSVVSLLEREELSLSYRRTNEAEEVVYRSTIIVLALGGVTLVLLILFLAVIFSDITRSNYLRHQLFEAKKYAEKLLKVKEQFLANMSHEIRTPLSSIIGLTRQLTRTNLSERQGEYVGHLNTSSEHLLNVINDILDYSKLEAGQLRIEKSPFNPVDVLTEVVNSMRIKANEKRIDLELNVKEQLLLIVHGDPFRLKQIMLNLVSNSIKFTERGRVTITLQLVEKTEEIARIQFTVADTGMGIPQEQQHLIFEEFTQADPSITRKHGGSGLGLTIVKRLTELQGGEIQIISKLNEGTAVSVTIPYPLKGDEKTGVIERDEYQLPSTLKVLVVDDDEINRVITLEMFRSLGVTADSTGNPKVAVEMVVNVSYDIVLTDIQMPEVSGYDLAELIEKQNRKIHILAITANSMIDNPGHFIEKGFSGHLIKPFNEDDLFNAIAPLVGVKKSRARIHEKEKLIDDVFDLSDIYRFAGGDRNSVRLILSTFLENTNKNLTDLNSLIRDKKVQQASSVAHKMKSGFNQFKIYHIAGILYKIENLENSQGKERTANILLNELNQQIKPVLKLLRKELIKLS